MLTIDRLPRQSQRPQPIARELSQMVLRHVLQLIIAFSQPLKDDIICTLAEQKYPALRVIHTTNNNAHPLTGAGEI